MANTRTLTQPASLTEWLAREQARAPLYAESAQDGQAYQPQASDLFIAPFAKCGTTWLQQIVHGLRTGGDTNAADLTHVMPWLEMAHYAGIDLHTPQPGSFRAFKSHLELDEDSQRGALHRLLPGPAKMPWSPTTTS